MGTWSNKQTSPDGTGRENPSYLSINAMRIIAEQQRNDPLIESQITTASWHRCTDQASFIQV
jgi:hypothetical protein